MLVLETEPRAWAGQVPCYLLDHISSSFHVARQNGVSYYSYSICLEKLLMELSSHEGK